MKIGEPDPGVGEPIQIGRVDLTTEGADIGKPQIVCHDDQEEYICGHTVLDGT